MWKSITLSVALLALSMTASASLSVTYENAGKKHFTMEVPDTWIVNVGTEEDKAAGESDRGPAPRVVTAMPEDGTTLWFGTWIPDGVKTLDDALEYLHSIKDVLIDEVKPAKGMTDEKLGKMRVRYSRGTGSKFGKPVDYFAMLFQLDRNRSGVAIYIGPAEATAAHGDELKAMLRSIKPVR